MPFELNVVDAVSDGDSSAAEEEMGEQTALGRDLMSMVPPPWQDWTWQTACLIATSDPDRTQIRLSTPDYAVHVFRLCDHRDPRTGPVECDQFYFDDPDHPGNREECTQPEHRAVPAWPIHIRADLEHLGWVDVDETMPPRGYGTARGVAAAAALCLAASSVTPERVTVQALSANDGPYDVCVAPEPMRRYAMVSGADTRHALMNWLTWLGCADLRACDATPASVSGELPTGTTFTARLVYRADDTLDAPTSEALTIWFVPQSQSAAVLDRVPRVDAVMAYGMNGALVPRNEVAAMLCGPMFPAS